MKKVLSFSLSAFLLCALSISLNVFAITIDEFEGDQSLNAGACTLMVPWCATGTLIGPNYTGTTRSTVIGGTRDVAINGLVGTTQARTRFVTEYGILKSSQDAGANGITQITWDGDASDNPFTVNPDGLGQIDFTQGGGTAIRLDVLSFDFPAGNPVTFRVRVFGEGNKGSEISYTISEAVNSLRSIDLPFANFAQINDSSLPWIMGTVDWTKVGAVRLDIYGLYDNIDLTIDRIGTNSTCKTTPDNDGNVFDLCGVCGGDNSTCLDCNNIPNGGTDLDVCGVCGGDGTSCLDCTGQLFGTADVDRCGACQGDGMSCLGCNQVDQRKLLRTLDGGAKAQERLIRKIAQQFLIIRRDDDAIRYAKRTMSKARRLMLRNWTLSWMLPVVSTTCQNKVFCVQISNLPIIDEYKGHADELRKVGRVALTRLLKAQAGMNTEMTRRFAKRIENLYLQNIKLADTVPVFESACS